MPIIKKQGTSTTHKAGNVLARIGPVSFEEKDGFSLGLYGRTATGKTTFWASYPGQLLAMICSATARPGELRSLTVEQKKRTKQVRIRHSDEVLEVCDYLNDGAGYDAAILDHGSALQDMIMMEILGLETIPVQKAWGMCTQQQYGTIATKMKSIYRKFLSVPRHRVAVFQERIFNDSNEGGTSEIISPSIGFGLMPSVAGFIGPECDYIIETFIRPKMVTKIAKINGKDVQTRVVVKDQYEYCARTGRDSLYTTKFRVPKGQEIPQIIVDPTYVKIKDVIG